MHEDAMSLKGVAKETVAIIEQGGYLTASGRRIDLRETIENAVQGTRLYRPAELDTLLGQSITSGQAASPSIEVTAETTAAAARRLVEAGIAKVTALNFASARNPGGGFLGGAKAQEEDLARCSALYNCLLTKPEYYEANRACSSMLYTDHIIYSPSVPFFRDEDLDLLESPYLCSIITAPAPNAGQMLLRDTTASPEIERCLRLRAEKVLAVAEAQKQRTLVLGAWGCGVFRNLPEQVAAVFHEWLAERFQGSFDRIVFAIHDRSRDGAVLTAFRRRFE
jgi:uncharacterized protein (TIGR02452 family)